MRDSIDVDGTRRTYEVIGPEDARSLGIVFLRLGVIPEAIQAFERAVELCRAAEARVLFDITATHLGYAYALSGRIAEGTTLMEEALAQPEYAHLRLLRFKSPREAARWLETL